MPHPSTRARRRIAAVVAVGSVGLLVSGGLLLGHAAHAALVDVPVTGAPGRLVLSADPHPAPLADLSPGEPVHWQVAARLEDASRATLSLDLRKDGPLVAHPRGLRVTVASCDQLWTGLAGSPVCGSGAREVVAGSPADDWRTSSPTFPLQPLSPAAPEYLLVTLAVEDSAAAAADRSLMGLDGTIAVGLTAVAMEETPAAPGGPAALPATGIDLLSAVSVGALAAGALGLGLALRFGRKAVR